MLLLNDYECSCGKIFEELADPSAPEKVKCPGCCQFGTATRLLCAPRIDPRLGVDAESFPSMGDKWVRRRQQHQKIEERRYREHGE